MIAGRVGGPAGKLHEALAARGPGALRVEERGQATLCGGRVFTQGEKVLVISGTASASAVLARGEEALSDLRGSFALALWDGKSLLLARDRFGERALAYVHSGNDFWFAPDAAVLRAAGAPVGALDRAALSDYLELLCVPAPRSIWSGVRKLEAGHVLRFRDGKVETHRALQRLVPGSSAGELDKAQVRSALQSAVPPEARNVVLAASTSWAPLLAVAPERKVVAVTYGAQDPAPGARVVLEGATLTSALEAAAGSPEPAGDASIVALHAGFAAAGPGQALVAHGGAPVFADAARYRSASRVPHSTRAGSLARLLQYVMPGSRRVSRAARTLSTSGGERVRALAEAFTPDDRRALLHSEARMAPLPGTLPERDLDAALAFDLDTLLPERFLPAVELAAARVGAEPVAPFLDLQVAQLVVPAPSREKLRGQGLLRGLFKEPLADDARAAPPLKAWLAGPLRTQLDDLLRPPSARIRTFMDPRGIDTLLQRSLAQDGDPRQAYALLMLERWARSR